MMDRMTEARRRAAKFSANGTGHGHQHDTWDEAVPFQADGHGPPFPLDLLPSCLGAWANAVATATQTPPDLPAMMALAIAGAGVAGKYHVEVRRGWSEPLNVFTVVALPPGDRKSSVFRQALDPVVEAEGEEARRLAPVIAAAASKRRVLENRLKAVEAKAAKADSPVEREEFEREAILIAAELEAHRVPAKPQYYCDDATPEKIAQMLAQQRGRLLQASAEGTALEIAKGRYSESANFDVYLKGHAGDPLRTDRVGREGEAVDSPALSVALAVQPSIVVGMADQASMKARGFLARFLYSIPASRVGSRETKPAPAPERVLRAYREAMLWLWGLPQPEFDSGLPTTHAITFSPAADDALADFERWLEPQLADGSDLSLLAGWANKLAGAVARLAGIIHVADYPGRQGGPARTIPTAPVEAAIQLGRDYLLPHAQAAFGLMGGDPTVAAAKAVLASLAELVPSGPSGTSGTAPPAVSRRQIYKKHHRRFPRVELLDPVLEILIAHGWLRPTGEGKSGRGGSPSPTYFVHPTALAGGRTPGATGATGATGGDEFCDSDDFDL